MAYLNGGGNLRVGGVCTNVAGLYPSRLVFVGQKQILFDTTYICIYIYLKGMFKKKTIFRIWAIVYDDSFPTSKVKGYKITKYNNFNDQPMAYVVLIRLDHPVVSRGLRAVYRPAKFFLSPELSHSLKATELLFLDKAPRDESSNELIHTHTHT